MMAARTTVIAALLSILQTTFPARADDLPAAIRSAFQIGSRDISFGNDPARIRLEGTDWYGNAACPYLRVLVNGRGPYTFLFDTGASYTFVSQRLVKAANLEVISRVPGHHVIVKMREVRVGSITIRSDVAVVEEGLEEDAIFGFNAFGSAYLTFDMAGRALTVSSKPLSLSPRAAWVPYVLDHRVPLVPLRIAGKMLPTLIDTGDDAYSWDARSVDLRGLLFDRVPLQAAKVYNPVTGFSRTLVTSVDGTLHLGPFWSERPAVAIDDALPVSDIGIDVVAQFVMEFDRRQQRVAFDPVFSGAAFRVPGFRTSGFSISYRTPGRHVGDVLPGMAPARAGMKEGDAVLRIDGQPASAVTASRWRALLQASAPLRVDWSSAGSARSATFPVVELK